jgi:hypothetical protein
MKREHIQTQHENKDGSDPDYWQDIVGWRWWNRDEICHGGLVGGLVDVVQSRCRRQVVDNGRRMAINKDKNRLRREQEESKR